MPPPTQRYCALGELPGSAIREETERVALSDRRPHQILRYSFSVLSQSTFSNTLSYLSSNPSDEDCFLQQSPKEV